MTRRAFSVALGGSAAFPGFASGDALPVVTLQAIAGARLPATLTITITSPEKIQRSLWELRTYRTTAPWLAAHLADVFPSAGIRPFLKETSGADLTYLIPFENLTARDRAWTLLNTDPKWTKVRPQFQSYNFGLYRTV
jgi:hypothetical protein